MPKNELIGVLAVWSGAFTVFTLLIQGDLFAYPGATIIASLLVGALGLVYGTVFLYLRGVFKPKPALGVWAGLGAGSVAVFWGILLLLNLLVRFVGGTAVWQSDYGLGLQTVMVGLICGGSSYLLLRPAERSGG